MFSYPEYVDIRDQNTVFASLLAESIARSGLTEGGLTTRVTAGVVSSNYFSTLGVTMAAGRAFTLDEERPGSGAAVAVVSYPFWLERGLRPDVVGQRIIVNGHELTIVGVAPEGFNGTMPVMSMDLWLPFGAASFVETRGALGPSVRVVNDRSVQSLLVTGTLKEGQTAASAESQLAALASALERAYPEHNRDQRLDRVAAIESEHWTATTRRCGPGSWCRGPDGGRVSGAAGGVPESRQHPPGPRQRPEAGDRRPPRPGWKPR